MREAHTSEAEGETFRSLDYLDSLRTYLEHLGHPYSKAFLMGVSGEAFKFFYDRTRPARGIRVFLQNPLRAACSALGFRHTIAFHEKQSDALSALQETLNAGIPVILPLNDQFPLVFPNLRVHSPNGPEIDLCDLAGAWRADEGFLELGLFGYYTFTIGERQREPKAREMYLGAFRRALKIAKAYRRVRGCSIGLQAYEELAGTLNAKWELSRIAPSEVYRISEWNGEASLLLLDSRRAALNFLRDAEPQFEEEERVALRKATRYYGRVVPELQRVIKVHPTTDASLDADLILPVSKSDFLAREYRRFFRACKRAADLVERANIAEYKAIDELQNVVNLSEKTKM